MDAPLFIKKAQEDAGYDRLIRDGLRASNVDQELIDLAMARLQPILLGLVDVSQEVHRGDMAGAIHKMQTNHTVLIMQLAFALSEAEGWKRVVKSQGNDG